MKKHFTRTMGNERFEQFSFVTINNVSWDGAFVLLSKLQWKKLCQFVIGITNSISLSEVVFITTENYELLG